MKRIALLVGLLLLPGLVLVPRYLAATTTAADSLPITPIHLLDFGERGSISGDCAHAEMQDTGGATATAPTNFDFRWVPCLGKDALTLLADDDVAERTYATGTGNTNPTVRLAFGDGDGSGKVNAGEPVYLTTGTIPNLDATTSRTSFTIRITAGPGLPAGRFVYGSDSDATTYKAGLKALTGSLAWVDGDTATAFTPPDTLYLLPENAAGYAKGSAVPASALQLYPASTASPSPSSSSSSAAGSTTPSSSSPTSPASSSSTFPTPAKSTPAPAAALALVAMLLGLLLGVRRPPRFEN